MTSDPSLPSRIHGCLLGGALADALGSAVEIGSLDRVRDNVAADELVDIDSESSVWFTDETQLSLYSLDGLLEALRWASNGVPADETACVWLAYLRWLRTQNVAVPEGAPAPPEQWLDRQPAMRHPVQPDEACLSGLSQGDMGSQSRPVNPLARGAGALVRSAPFGLMPYVGAETVFKLSSNAAALTHGHPSAIHSGAAFSLMVHHMVHDGGCLTDAVEVAMRRLDAESGEPEVVRMLAGVLELARREPLAPRDITTEFGPGDSAIEVLAIGLYSALTAEAADADDPADQFRTGVAMAINHDGKSDSAGSVAGNLLGARYGDQVLPASWLRALQGREVIFTMADSLVDVALGQ